mmetsp:Transcript_17103/g.64776  ORF Transcript_17103/g.64776 Transcript_17103/m.64776 type:complete len:351 (+) Transcript_17103:803-1855(+)
MRSRAVSRNCCDASDPSVSVDVSSTDTSAAPSAVTPAPSVSVASPSSRRREKPNRPRDDPDARLEPSDAHADTPPAGPHAHDAHSSPDMPSAVSFTHVAPALENVVDDPWSSVRLLTPTSSPATLSAAFRTTTDGGSTARPCSSTVNDATDTSSGRCTVVRRTTWVDHDDSPANALCDDVVRTWPTCTSSSPSPASVSVTPASTNSVGTCDPDDVTLPSTSDVRASGMVSSSNSEGADTLKCTDGPKYSSSTSKRRRPPSKASCVWYVDVVRPALSASTRRTPQPNRFVSGSGSTAVPGRSHQNTVPAAFCDDHDPYAAPARARTVPRKSPRPEWLTCIAMRPPEPPLLS